MEVGNLILTPLNCYDDSADFTTAVAKVVSADCSKDDRSSLRKDTKLRICTGSFLTRYADSSMTTPPPTPPSFFVRQDAEDEEEEEEEEEAEEEEDYNEFASGASLAMASVTRNDSGRSVGSDSGVGGSECGRSGIRTDDEGRVASVGTDGQIGSVGESESTTANLGAYSRLERYGEP